MLGISRTTRRCSVLFPAFAWSGEHGPDRACTVGGWGGMRRHIISSYYALSGARSRLVALTPLDSWRTEESAIIALTSLSESKRALCRPCLPFGLRYSGPPGHSLFSQSDCLPLSPPITLTHTFFLFPEWLIYSLEHSRGLYHNTRHSGSYLLPSPSICCEGQSPGLFLTVVKG